jgi:MHS family proline/betaine transporter-like MFS transporter
MMLYIAPSTPAVYTQLSSTLAGVFFPASHWMTPYISFYGVYAAGFLARPLGAVLFGHVSAHYM